MVYEEFDLDTALRNFDLRTAPPRNLFPDVPPVEPSWVLQKFFEMDEIVYGSNNEKARSELLIAPFFSELWRHHQGQFSFWSGIDFDVDAAQGLHGSYDFMVSRSPIFAFLQPPLTLMAKAKNDDVPSGYGACVAGMVAARLFNAQHGLSTPRVYGVVSAGDLWSFMQLEDKVLTLDSYVYPRREAAKILGILVHLIS